MKKDEKDEKDEKSVGEQALTVFCALVKKQNCCHLILR